MNERGVCRLSIFVPFGPHSTDNHLGGTHRRIVSWLLSPTTPSTTLRWLVYGANDMGEDLMMDGFSSEATLPPVGCAQPPTNDLLIERTGRNVTSFSFPHERDRGKVSLRNKRL